MKRTVITVLVVTLAVLSAITGRVVCSSRSEWLAGHGAERRALGQADAAARSAGLDEAVIHYRRAARWYAPGSGYVTRSLDALARIGTAAEQQGDLARALDAHRAIRSAILGARSVYTPHADRLAQANGRIARLSAAVQGEKQSAEARAKLEAWHLTALRQDTAPAVGWSVLAVLAFLGWVSAAFVFIYRAITPDDRLLVRPALIWGGVILVCLLLWVLGLSQA